ncbi:MAG TPA: PilZ domain-containing protein [Myxococcaceae bacterium]|nr:PilZ domain-containing protein [Myxococcaceae bacterium]
MTSNRRAFERIATSIEVRVHVCDPVTLHPLTMPVTARVGDVSLGGVRMEIPQLPASLADAFGPGVVVGMTPAAPGLTLGVLHLTVAWFTSRVDGGEMSGAAMGAQFRKVSEADRAVLVSYATATRRRPVQIGAERPRRRWLWWATAAAIAAVGLWRYRVLHERVSEQDSQLDALAAQVRGQAPEPPPRSSRPQADPVQAASGTAPVKAALPPDPVPKVEPPAAASRAASEPDPFVSLKYRTAGTVPDGIQMASLELLNGDFVGAVVSTLGEDRSLSVALEYACDGAGPGDASCRCETPQMTIRARRRTEFACTPKAVPKSTREPLQITFAGAPPNDRGPAPTR